MKHKFKWRKTRINNLKYGIIEKLRSNNLLENDNSLHSALELLNNNRKGMVYNPKLKSTFQRMQRISKLSPQATSDYLVNELARRGDIFKDQNGASSKKVIAEHRKHARVQGIKGKIHWNIGKVLGNLLKPSIYQKNKDEVDALWHDVNYKQIERKQHVRDFFDRKKQEGLKDKLINSLKEIAPNFIPE